jgi:hypothetical protein
MQIVKFMHKRYQKARNYSGSNAITQDIHEISFFGQLKEDILHLA